MQDTVKGRDRAIAELKETVQIYEEERNWIKRFFSGFYQLLNIRLMLRKMGFSDDRIAEMYRTPQRGTAKAYSGLYKSEFTEEDSEICCNFKELKYKQLQTKIAMITENKVTEIFCMQMTPASF